jgi:hypothetical protein
VHGGDWGLGENHCFAVRALMVPGGNWRGWQFEGNGRARQFAFCGHQVLNLFWRRNRNRGNVSRSGLVSLYRYPQNAYGRRKPTFSKIKQNHE